MALFQCNFISYTLMREVQITVILPTITCPEAMSLAGTNAAATHAGHAPYPVLYLLHGFANNHTVWGRYTSLERYAEERRIAVVTISGENKGYRNASSQANANIIGRPDRHFDYLAYEVPEFVKANFNVSKRPEDTYIAGLSMGSAGALLHSLTLPENFRAVGAFSGPLMEFNAMMLTDQEKAAMTEEQWDKGVSREAIMLAERAAAAGKNLPDYYVATGMKDSPEASAAFARFLERAGAKVHTDFSRDYGHEWQFWDESLLSFLDWLPRTDPYAGTVLFYDFLVIGDSPHLTTGPEMSEAQPHQIEPKQ